MTIKRVNWRYLYVLTYCRDAYDNQNSQIAIKIVNWRYLRCNKNHKFSRLITIALESSRSNPQHLLANVMPFSFKIVNIYSCTTKLQRTLVDPMWLLLNSQSHSFAILHDCFTILSLYMLQVSLFIRFIYIT